MPTILPKSSQDSRPRGDVARARNRLERVENKRDAVVLEARSDGTVTKAERGAIKEADRRVELSQTHLRLQKAERLVRRLRRDAFADGKAGPAEKAALEKAKGKVERLASERKELRFELNLTNEGGPTDLVISSFNVTGSSHTGPGSSKPELETGKKRMRYVAELLEKHKVDIIGFQKLQGDQLQELKRLTDNKYGVYPGFKLGRRESVNSVAWDKEKWALVKPGSIQIPYFNGNKRPMPVVLLRNKATGQMAYFANFHNPADTKTFKNQERYRDAATRLQVALVNRLIKKTGLPVFLTGDMNENREYYEKMTRGTELDSAHRGPNGKRPNKTGIDWIFGSDDIRFSDYDKNRSKLVRKTTNHPMVITRARIRADKN